MQEPEFIHHRCENGIEVVIEHLPTAYSAALGMFVQTGSRDEAATESGLSHFLEHMVFKGTAHRSALQVNQELDDLGGHSNAYTSEEQTVYYATVLPKYQERIVDLLLDLLQPSLREEDFETEKQVIIEEIAKYDDAPPFGAFERAMLNYFPDASLGRPILGTVASVRALTADGMRSYFDRSYVPENLVVAAAGNVDHRGLIAQVTELTAGWQSRGSGRVREAVSPRTDNHHDRIHVPDSALHYAIQMWPGLPINDEQRYALRLLTTILGDDSGSRLFWELIDTGRAEAAALWTQELSDCGLVMGYLSSTPDVIDDNVRLFNEVLFRAREAGIEEAELCQAQNKTVASVILHSEQPTSRMFNLGNRWIAHRRYESIDQTVDKYRAVTLDEVNAVAAMLSEPRVSVRVG